MAEQTIEDQIAELELAESVTADSTDTDKGGNGKLTAAQRKAGKEAKPPKYYLPFLSAVFSRPDRHVEVKRKNRKGELTGVIGTLLANVTIPMIGGVQTIKVGIWCDSVINRDTGMVDETLSISLPRDNFSVVDGQQAIYDEWRQTVLDQFGKWETSAAGMPNATKSSQTPRLVRSRPIPVKPVHPTV